jgi:predicted dehydrogenase
LTRPFNVAVLGAGDMGVRHVNAWTNLGHRVVSITDADRERAAEVSERHGIGHVLTDYREAVSDPEVDVVAICLPLAFHAPATVLAARHGKHVFTEKPLCRTVAEADEMEAAVRGAGVHFGIGFQRNLAEGVGLLRRWASEGRLGHPLVFSSDLLQEVRPKRAMHDRNGNNGPLTDAGCHYYLLWQTVFRSKPKTVYAQGRVLAVERPEVAHLAQLAIDTAVVTVEYESGDIGTMTVSWGLAEGFRLAGRPDRVIGPRGGAEGAVGSGLTLYECDREERVEIEPKDLHEVQVGLFVEAIRDGKPFPHGFREGRQMLAVTDAIMESIDTGRPVAVRYA